MASKRSLKTVKSDDEDASKRAKKELKGLPKSMSISTKQKASVSSNQKKADDRKKAIKESEGNKISSLVPSSVVPTIDREQQLELNKQLLAAVKTNLYQKADLELVKQLVEKGADVNAKNEKGNPVLVEALGGLRALVQFLLESGADPNCERADGTHFIELVISHEIGGSSTNLMEMVFNAGAKMNYMEDGKKVCPAIWGAISSGQEHIIDYVLERGADVTVLDDEGNSVLAHLVQLESDEVAMYDWELERFKTKYMKIFKSHGAKFTKADKKDNHHKTSSWKKPRPFMGWRRRFGTARWRF